MCVRESACVHAQDIESARTLRRESVHASKSETKRHTLTKRPMLMSKETSMYIKRDL